MILAYSCNGKELQNTGIKWTHDHQRQTLFVVTEDDTPGAIHKLIVSFNPPLQFRIPLDESLLLDSAWIWTPLLATFLAVISYFFFL